jgi:hypothetical protein
MYKSRLTIAVMAALSLLVLVQPGWAVLNNGFQTDYLYACREVGQGGQIRTFQELDGATVADFLPDGSNWETLAFAGTGTNDARLFVAKPLAGPPPDIQIDQVDSAGVSVNSLLLSSILPGNTVGTSLSLGNIRYNPHYPDSLFVSARSNVSGQSAGMVWELNLALTTLKNTYTGPTMPTPDPCDPLPPGGDCQERPTNIAIGDDGVIYMVARHLNSATADSKGDLVKFTGLNTFQVLVDGATMNVTDSRWTGPVTVMFRKGDPLRGDGSDTLVVTMRPPTSTVAAPALEFYLNTTLHPVDANGNLQAGGSPFTVLLGWNGHQDPVTGVLWTAVLRGGLYGIRRNNALFTWELSRNWADADSPPYYGPVAPVFDPMSNDTALPMAAYTRQLVLSQGTAPLNWLVIMGPAGATVSSTGLVSGWTPTKNDAGNVISWQVQASNAQGSALAIWQTEVYRASINGFIPDYVYVSRCSSGDYRTASIRLHRKTDGTEVTRWDPGANPNYKYWTTLTFSGVGRNDDARLFVAQPLNMTDNWHGTDILIAELNASGVTLNSKPLSQLMGGQSPGSYLDLGPIRYNRYHNTLIVSADPNGNDVNALATAWEVDLSLSTLVHTYVGPACGAGRPIATAFDERTGRLIMGGRNLNNNADKGNLIAFETAGRVASGTTTAYTTLIDGPTRYTTDTAWYKPVAPIYRAGSPTRGDGSDTVLDLTGAAAGGAQTYEALLYQYAGDGSLARRTLTCTNYLGYNGQQDESTGQVWFANFRNGFSVLSNDDSVTRFQSGNDWWDIDTPPYQQCNAPPVDLDGDSDVDQADFAIFQVCYTGSLSPGSHVLPQACACVDLGDDNNDSVPDHDGDIDGFDYTAFEDCASGPGILANPTCGG